MVLVLPADCWNSAVFGVVGGWCLRVGRCRCGPDRFSVLVLWFGPWFWVLRADGLTVVDCRSVRDSLGSSGFVVLPRQTDQCRPMLVWTGSDSVLWSPIWSRYATRPVVSSPCHHVIVSSHHHPDSASRRITDQSARQPVSPPTGQLANQSAANQSARQPVRRSPVSFRFPLPDPLFTPSIPPSIRSHLSHIHPQF